MHALQGLTSQETRAFIQNISQNMDQQEQDAIQKQKELDKEQQASEALS